MLESQMSNNSWLNSIAKSIKKHLEFVQTDTGPENSKIKPQKKT